MNITKEETGKLTATIKVEVQEDDYREPVEKKLKEYRKSAQVAGFRPGKAPMGMIKKMYEPAVVMDEVNNVLSEAITGYLKDNQINTLGNPLVNTEKSQKTDFAKDKSFVFYFDIAWQPEIQVPLDESVKVDYYNIDADDSQVEEYLNDIRKHYGKSVELKKCEDKAIIYVNIPELDAEKEEEQKEEKESDAEKFTAFFAEDKVADKETREKLWQATLGDKLVMNPAKVFENKADVRSMLKLPTDESQDHKMDHDYTMIIGKIKGFKPAEINEELFEKVFSGDQIKNEEELRQRIRKDIEQSLEKESEKFFFHDAVKALREAVGMELPQEFLKEFIKQNNMEAKEEERMTEEDIEKNFDSYLKSMQWQLIENKIIEENDLKVTQEELKEKVRSLLSMQMGASAEGPEMEETMNKLVDTVISKQEKEIEGIKNQIIQEKVTNLFKEKISITEKNISYEDFVKLANERSEK